MTDACDTQNSRASSQISAHYILTYRLIDVRYYIDSLLMRLMFAVGTSIEPEILLIDEIFSTGDANFQQKAQSRMKNLINASEIFILASHSPESLKQHCNRVFKLEHGKVVDINLSTIIG